MKKREFLRHISSVAAVSAFHYSPIRAMSSSERDRPIRIAQIGMAHGHANKIEVYRRLPQYEVVGIVEENEELFERRKNESAFAGLKRLQKSDVVEDKSIEAVLIESEIDDLIRHGHDCVNASKHIHLDKPAGVNYSDFASLIETAKVQQRVVQMGYMYRYNPAFQLLKKFVKNGWLGEIFEVHAVMSKKVSKNERDLLARYPGGMMFELGCHLIDILVDLMGEPESISSFKTHASYWNDDLWDNMLAVLKYSNAIATVKSSCLEVDGGARRHFVVCGANGTFHIEPLDNPKVLLTLEKKVGEYSAGRQELTFPKYVRYVDDALEMANVIRGKANFSYSYEHDLQTQRTLMKAAGVGL